MILLGTEVPAIEDLPDVSDVRWQDWLIAGIIFVTSLILARVASSLVRRGMQRSGVAPFVATLVGRVAAALVIAVGLIYAFGRLGIAVGPIIGALGIVGIALAFAFQDILENLIAGVMLMISRPFKSGDQIESVEFSGTVEDVTLRTVALRTFDGVRVYLPNAMVWKAPIVNTTAFPVRRTTIEVGVAYETDLDLTIPLIVSTLRGIDDVLDEPTPQAFVESFGDSAVTVAVWFWHGSQMGDEWRVRDTAARRLKAALDEAGIDIPFPQRTLRFRDTMAWPDPGTEEEATD